MEEATMATLQDEEWHDITRMTDWEFSYVPFVAAVPQWMSDTAGIRRIPVRKGVGYVMRAEDGRKPPKGMMVGEAPFRALDYVTVAVRRTV